MECARCKSGAVLELRYFGERLCGRCFSGLFEKRLKRGMRAGRLLGKRDTVVAGLSGGAGSMVLLSVFSRLFCKAPESRLVAVTVDDGRPGRVSRAVSFCRSLGVEHHVCKAGKEGFWPALVRKARLLKADRLAVGSVLDDDVVFALERIVKGVPAAVREDSLKVVRPLRDFPMEEVVLYARLNGVPYAASARRRGSLEKSISRMVEDAECCRPGSKFRLLKSVDAFMKAASVSRARRVSSPRSSRRESC